MFGLDSPRLLGSWTTVLAATLPSNKFYLLYILPCVWKFFSNPRSDHDTNSFRNVGEFNSFSCFAFGPSIFKPAEAAESFLCF